MANGFLDDLPELDMPGKKRKKKSPEPKDQAIRYIRLRCPNCHSDRVPVQHTNPQIGGNKIRHHKCENCDYVFKSVEKIV